MLIRGYGSDDRIVYGTEQIVPVADLAKAPDAPLQRLDIAYVHARWRE